MKAKNSSASRRSKKNIVHHGQPLQPSAQMPVIHPHAAGIDVGATSHWVCVPEDAVAEGQSSVREFSAFTKDLDELVEWLLKCGVKTVAMESTSVYWIPLFQKLEAAGLEAVLVNARHVRHVPGRKTDCKDCQWLQRLHSYGLLNGSFRPSDDICALRSLMRHRDNLSKTCGQEVQHMQQALNYMNILLRTVAPAVGRSDTWLGIFHRRMRARLGPAAANTATARKLACMVYHLLKYKEEYIDVDCLIYQEKIRKSRIVKLCKQAEELGYEMIRKAA